MKERVLASCLAMLAVLSSAAANADPSGVTPKSASPRTPTKNTATRAPMSALASVASDLALALGEVPRGALVVAGPLTSDLETSRGPNLVGRLRDHVARRLEGAHTLPTIVSLEQARSAATRAPAFVYVELEIVRGELRASADAYVIEPNGWERLRRPPAPPKAHAYAHASMDAEIRSFFSPIALEQAELHKAKHDESDVLAVACGDLDNDGGAELVLVSRTRVVVGKLRGDRLLVERRASWPTLSRLRPTPLREALATIVIPHGRDEALVGLSDRGGVALSAMLTPLRTLTGLPVPGDEGQSCASISPELGGFGGPLLSCDESPTEAVREPVFGLATFDAIALREVASQTGAMAQVLAAREPSGTVRVRWSDSPSNTHESSIDGAGAQLVIADLDLDGRAEIVSTTDASRADAITIWSTSHEGLTLRRRLPTKEPVRALAACPPEQHGLPGLVAIVGSEVWWLR
jgi:hypothetical protein